MLSQSNGNEYNTNIWWYRKIVLWIVDVFREYSIEVELVLEHYTSKECSVCVRYTITVGFTEDCTSAIRLGGRLTQM
jgi:transposase